MQRQGTSTLLSYDLKTLTLPSCDLVTKNTTKNKSRRVGRRDRTICWTSLCMRGDVKMCVGGAYCIAYTHHFTILVPRVQPPPQGCPLLRLGTHSCSWLS